MPRKLKNDKTVFDVRVQYGKIRVSKTVRQAKNKFCGAYSGKIEKFRNIRAKQET